MGIVQDLLRDVPLPRIAPVRQRFSAPELRDVAAAVGEELGRPGVGDAVRPGMRIAVAVGSRGVARIADITAAIVAELRARGATPFVVPAMGSHGGATAAGQLDVLARLGVTERSAGCEIRSSMEVVEIGRLANGLPVFMDRNAHEADGVVPVNRVKPHTSFRGPSESGLVKMIAIGLGKQRGADACHALGFAHMAEHVVAMAEVALATERIPFGVAVVENPEDRPMKIAAVPAREIVARDRELLALAWANMPRIPFDPMDVLVVDRIGKEFSGTGMDPNLVGRYTTPYASGGPRIEKIAVLDVTDATHGNGLGIGLADFTTRRLVDRLDLDAMYANALTSTVVVPVRIPATLPTEKEAIQAAVKTCGAKDRARARLVRVRNTLHLGALWVSEALLAEARANPDLTVRGEPEPMRFDEAGRLANAWEDGR
ncbi:MAG TPA: lactate racemase domain-containing protein [Anaeromyxobacter sp.]|nr:lactate racemase domain-containing protein [Anaeromyxobacter sp.]